MNTETVKATELKPGMMLVDPMTEQPYAEIDHKMRAVRNSGNVTYLAFDLEAGRYIEVHLFKTRKVEVVA